MSSPALSRHRPASRGAGTRDRARTGDHRPTDSPVGRYHFDSDTGNWWWSPDMRGVLGIDASTEPGTDAVLSTQHPADRERLRSALGAACREGRSFAMEIHVRHPVRGQRSVVLTGDPVHGDDGVVCGVEGVCADVTGARPVDDAADRDALQAEVAQMRAAMASRAVIEQAKGALMLLTGCGERIAFELLTHISSHTHRKVREVAQQITASAAGHGVLPADVRAILRDACPPARPLL